MPPTAMEKANGACKIVCKAVLGREATKPCPVLPDGKTEQDMRSKAAACPAATPVYNMREDACVPTPEPASSAHCTPAVAEGYRLENACDLFTATARLSGADDKKCVPPTPETCPALPTGTTEAALMAKAQQCVAKYGAGFVYNAGMQACTHAPDSNLNNCTPTPAEGYATASGCDMFTPAQRYTPGNACVKTALPAVCDDLPAGTTAEALKDLAQACVTKYGSGSGLVYNSALQACTYAPDADLAHCTPTPEEGYASASGCDVWSPTQRLTPGAACVKTALPAACPDLPSGTTSAGMKLLAQACITKYGADFAYNAGAQKCVHVPEATMANCPAAPGTPVDGYAKAPGCDVWIPAGRYPVGDVCTNTVLPVVCDDLPAGKTPSQMHTAAQACVAKYGAGFVYNAASETCVHTPEADMAKCPDVPIQGHSKAAGCDLWTSSKRLPPGTVCTNTVLPPVCGDLPAGKTDTQLKASAQACVAKYGAGFVYNAAAQKCTHTPDADTINCPVGGTPQQGYSEVSGCDLWTPASRMAAGSVCTNTVLPAVCDDLPQGKTATQMKTQAQACVTKNGEGVLYDAKTGKCVHTPLDADAPKCVAGATLDPQYASVSTCDLWSATQRMGPPATACVMKVKTCEDDPKAPAHAERGKECGRLSTVAGGTFVFDSASDRCVQLTAISEAACAAAGATHKVSSGCKLWTDSGSSMPPKNVCVQTIVPAPVLPPVSWPQVPASKVDTYTVSTAEAESKKCAAYNKVGELHAYDAVKKACVKNPEKDLTMCLKTPVPAGYYKSTEWDLWNNGHRMPGAWCVQEAPVAVLSAAMRSKARLPEDVDMRNAALRSEECGKTDHPTDVMVAYYTAKDSCVAIHTDNNKYCLSGEKGFVEANSSNVWLNGQRWSDRTRDSSVCVFVPKERCSGEDLKRKGAMDCCVSDQHSKFAKFAC